METLTNSKQIEEIVNFLRNIKVKIEESTNEMGDYLNYLKDDKQFEEIPNETEESAIERAGDIRGKLGDIGEKRKEVLNKGKETIELIENVKLKIKSVVEICEKDEIHLENANDELIVEIIDLEKRKTNKLITPLQQQIDDIKNKSNKRIQDLEGELKHPDKYKKKKDEERKKRDEEKRKRKEQEILNNEMKQIEEWTGMKVGNIIFDSTDDDWNINTTEFPERIKNKSNLIFIIEDEDGNKFGGYVNSKIDKYQSWINDSKSFVFSLKSNGRLNGMLKFDISHSEYAFYLYDQSHIFLFLFGNGSGVNDIQIRKENNNIQSYCSQTTFNYNGIQNALCGKSWPIFFTPKRITVIQLI